MNSLRSMNRPKNPPTSVTVVAKIVADWAGSNPSRFMMNGIAAPLDAGERVIDDQREADDQPRTPIGARSAWCVVPDERDRRPSSGR